MNFDLNCDLGEGEPRARTAALMRAITSGNVACGGHAGSVASMRSCVRLANRFGVRLGAHPGWRDTTGFGRAECDVTANDLELILLQQVSALERIAREQRVPLHHVKLHGELYHSAESDPVLARRYAETVAREWPQAKIFARVGGRVAAAARRKGVVVWPEAFLDRGYRDDGTLVPRRERGALLTTARQVLARLRRLQGAGAISSVSGKLLRVRARTLCLHSDTPHAIRLAEAVARCLARA